MGDWANDQDLSVTPRRYLQRQWKKNKPYLPPCDSLPVLRLCPNRPLFVCAQCGFSNAWIPLCLWCEWTSTEATKQFEANLPRPRRLSAPSRTVPPSKKTRHRSPRRKSADSTISSAGPHTPQNERGLPSSVNSCRGVPGITTVLEAVYRDMCHDDRRVDPHHVGAVDHESSALSVVATDCHDVQKETVDSGGVHRVVTATSITPPLPTSSFPNVAPESEGELYKDDSEDRQLRENSTRHRRILPALSVTPPPMRFRTSCRSSPTVERRATENVMITQAMDSAISVLMESSNATRSTGVMGMSDGGHMWQSTPSTSSSQCSPERGLRRTKKTALFNRGSSVSLRSRSPCSPLRESVDIYSTSATEARRSHAPSLTASHDHDIPPVRLGHPNRPYYSAIRKDMSRPTSPVFSLGTPRTSSPISSHADYVPRGTKSLDCGDRSGIPYADELRPMSLVLSSQGTSPVAGSGCSLSGEMELRMNLARWRQENAPDEPGGYHFRERSRSRTRVNMMKGRVKQLGKGLKEFVFGKP